MEANTSSQASISPVPGIEGNLFAFFSALRAWPQIDIHDEPELLWSISDIPFPLFNSVLRANLPSSRAEGAIEDAINRCRSRRVPMLWWTGPSTRPADLARRLAQHGFHAEDARGMAVSLLALRNDPLQPPGLVVEQVHDDSTMSDWCRVLCEGFELPGVVGDAFLDLSRTLGLGPRLALRHYIGRVEGESVAISSLFLGGGVAGIYNVATLPRVRRRGIGGAMTFAPLRDALVEGYTLAILHSSEMGAGVYRRLGFQEHCRIGQYVWMGEP